MSEMIIGDVPDLPTKDIQTSTLETKIRQSVFEEEKDNWAFSAKHDDLFCCYFKVHNNLLGPPKIIDDYALKEIHPNNAEHLSEKERNADKIPIVKWYHKMKSHFMTTSLKYVLIILMILHLPLFILDSFMDYALVTDEIAHIWYHMDESIFNASMLWRRIKMKRRRALVSIVIYWLFLSIPFLVIFVLWPNDLSDALPPEGSQGSFVKLTMRIIYFLPVIFLFGLVLTKWKDQDYSVIDSPSNVIRWKNWQNWLVILLSFFDVFLMLSLVIREEVPYNKDADLTKIFSKYWSSLGIQWQWDIPFWVSIGLTVVFLLLCMWIYYNYDILKSTETIVNSPLLINIFPILSTSLFFFISLNLLRGTNCETMLHGNTTRCTWSYDYQRITSIFALVGSYFFIFCATFYRGILAARTDNAFISSQQDIKCSVLHEMFEQCIKLGFIGVNIFSDGFLGPWLIFVLIVSMILAFSLILMNFRKNACCIRGFAAMKVLQFMIVFYTTLVTFIAYMIWGTTDVTKARQDKGEWAPVIILFSGCLLIIIVGSGVIFYKHKYVWRLRKSGCYMWGFNHRIGDITPLQKEHNNKNKIEDKWWRETKPKEIGLGMEMIRNAGCGGHSFTMLVSDTGLVYSCGMNDRGQLGHGDDTYRYLFTPVMSLWKLKILIKRVACGDEHSLLVSFQGHVFSCGRGQEGQLGHPEIDDKTGKPYDHVKPKLITTLSQDFNEMAVHISAGYLHSAVISRRGYLYMFGSNSQGQLGITKEDLPESRVVWLSDIQPHDHSDSGDTADVSLKDIKQLLSDNNVSPDNVTISLFAYHHRGKFISSQIICKNAEDVEKVISINGSQVGELKVITNKGCFIPKRVKNLPELNGVSCGHFHTLILSKNKNVFSVGRGKEGQLGHGDDCDVTTFKKIDALTSDKLVVKFPLPSESSIFHSLQKNDELTYKINAISAGAYHSLVKSKRCVYSFGLGNVGQLGLGMPPDKNKNKTAEYSNVPWVQPDSPSRIPGWCVLTPTPIESPEVKNRGCIFCEAGYFHSGFITLGRKLFTFGHSKEGRLGDGQYTEDIFSPKEIVSFNGKTIRPRRIIMSHRHNIILGKNLTTHGLAYTFGSGNYFCGLGVRVRGRYSQPIPKLLIHEGLKDPFLTYKDISCGGDHTALLTNNGVFTFGSNQKGQLGRTPIVTDYAPEVLIEMAQTRVRGDSKIVDDPTYTPKIEDWIPTLLKFPDESIKVIAVGCGWDYTMCVTDAGTLYSFGTGKVGQLGLGENTLSVWEPTLVPDIKNCSQVSCSRFFAAIICDGVLYMTGSDGDAIDNSYEYSLPSAQGCLGQGNQLAGHIQYTFITLKGDNNDSSILFPHKIIQVSCGLGHTLAITSDFKLYSWGWGYFKQIGIKVDKRDTSDLSSNKTIPTLINGGDLKETPVVKVAAGLIHSIVLSQDGRVYTFGMGGHAQLGTGQNVWFSTPKLLPPFPDKIEDVAAGTYQTAAVTKSGDVYVWGSYLLGALGIGDIQNLEWNRSIVGSLMGRKNKKVSIGNHFAGCI